MHLLFLGIIGSFIDDILTVFLKDNKEFTAFNEYMNTTFIADIISFRLSYMIMKRLPKANWVR